MCQVIVFLENYTDETFELFHTLEDKGVQQVSIPGSINRNAKLVWHGHSTECMSAARYRAGHLGDAALGESQAADKEEKSEKQQTGFSLVIAAILQSSTKSSCDSENAATGATELKLACFSATMEKDYGPDGDSETSEGLRRALTDAKPVEATKQSTRTNGCEWRVTRCDARVLEVWLRVLPVEGVKRVTVQHISKTERELQRQLSLARAIDVGLARAYRAISRALDRQAELLAEHCMSEPVEPDRLRNLDTKHKADFLLLFLLTLLKRLRIALSNWKGASDIIEREAEEEKPEGVASDAAAAATPPQDDKDKLQAAQPSGGATSWGWSYMKNMYDYVADSVTGSSEEQRLYEVLSKALIAYSERTFDGLLGLLRLSANEPACQTGRALIPRRRQGTEQLEEETGRAEELRDSLVVALSTESGQDLTQIEQWSREQAMEVGSVHKLVPLLGQVQLLGVDVAPSLQSAVDGLNRGRHWCPEAACAVFCPDRREYILLYKAGCHEEAIELISQGTKSSPSSSKSSSGAKRSFFFSNDLEVPVADAPDVTEEGMPPWTALELDWRGLPPLPYQWLLARELLALLLGGEGCFFNARSRAALFDFFALFGVPPRLVARWEAQVGAALFEVLETQTVLEELREKGQTWRRSKVALGVFGGGAVLAVTGGLAAPAMAGGVAAVGSYITALGSYLGFGHASVVLGTTVMGLGASLATMSTAGAMLLFGSAGAGLAGWKLSHRWGDLQEFEFVCLLKAKSYSTFSIDLADESSIQSLDESLASSETGELQAGMLLTSATGASVALLRGSRLRARTEIQGGTSSNGAGDSSGGAGGDSSLQKVIRFDFEREIDQVNRAVHMAVFASGWVNSEDDFVAPWADVAPTVFPSSGHLAVKWESEELLQLGQVMQTLVAQEVASQAASFWFRACGVAAASAGSYAAMTVSWPVSVVAMMANLNNAWTVGAERAYLAGQCLAHVLADRSVIGQRPVTLVGHSIGARMLFNCLLELHDMQEFNVVDDVVLLGAPVPSSTSEWQRARAVASGRVINGYVPSDWVIAFFYRYQEWGLGVAGLAAVDAPGVENYDLTRVGVTGHRDYIAHLADILALMQIGERKVVH